MSGAPVAEDNIINRRGGESIYQSCVNLRRRLSEVPNFESYLQEMDDDDRIRGNTDPVASLWNCLRNGYPLLSIYNASGPEEPLEIDPAKVTEAKRPKAATFKFLQACLQDLAFPQQDCFLITDLYGESTTGFIKVIKMVNRVVDILEMQGQLKQSEVLEAPSAKTNVKLTKREHILKELLETERDYVHHLQNLQALKKELEETGALTGDASHQIFLNLNNLLDFAQRFLIRMEQHYALPEKLQNWGHLFFLHEDAFRQYEPFIANQMRCDEACMKEWDNIKSAPRHIDLQQMVAQPKTLNGFFVKPFQRLTRYPLMLLELRKQLEDEQLRADITHAVNCIQNVLDFANQAIYKDQLAAAVVDLSERVDDWKALKMESFGDLLRFGTFQVVKGDSGKDSEREYHIYLFERILLCCKDINPNKQKSKLMMQKDRPYLNAKGKARLQLKGRIYMANVTDIVCLQKPGLYRIQIFWKGDPGVVDNFIIRYINEDTMRNWYKDIDTQRVIQAERRTLRNTGTSDSEFTSMEGMAHMPNPYQQQEFDADDANHKDVLQSEFPMSRNASSTSLRTRSATNGSTTSVPHHNTRPRFAVADPMLSVHTQFPGGGNMSPGDRNMSSYFSPTAETASARSSSQSAAFSFGRQNTNSTTPSTVWNEDTLRYTAPALSRVTSREGSISGGYFPPQPIVRGSQRPSLPPLSGPQAQSANGMTQRMRSASSPDIHNHNNNAESRRYMGVHTMQTVDDVPVPPIPAHMANMKAPVNRSQNASPTNNQLPIRTQPQIHTTHFNEPEYNDNCDSEETSDHATSPLTQEPQESEEGDYMPTQLKAKVNFEDNYVTLVIASNILFRSLTDRVDAKLARFTDRSIESKSVRLRYRDEDGDFVTIDSDEAVQLAFMEWREQHREMLAKGLVGEIELYCQVVD
ncbi:Rho guanyl nucleotide exchange factor, putative [Penicillium digitatum PHI26]|uniref:Rho guanyl nucleotide exchange factor, putative n=1 Tax=Penicillium digitatum (strain PHI26 / CECT 20796) TaxID=1170229 RepID=K9F6D7_PEND2|nr:Rho guanyl nucleotide exchange factor, putative [Penicillium digitatum PHI26]